MKPSTAMNAAVLRREALLAYQMQSRRERELAKSTDAKDAGRGHHLFAGVVRTLSRARSGLRQIKGLGEARALTTSESDHGAKTAGAVRDPAKATGFVSTG